MYFPNRVTLKLNISEWGSPTFILSNNNGTVRFLTNFIKINQINFIKPFPIPKIQNILLKIEGFAHELLVDLNIRYHPIKLSPGTKQLFNIVLPWVKYEYQKLPIGVCNKPNIFQKKIP